MEKLERNINKENPNSILDTLVYLKDFFYARMTLRIYKFIFKKIFRHFAREFNSI